jgi:hypothetical protein
MADFPTAYRDTRGRVVDLLLPLDDRRLATPVPATPAWTVKDVVAHLTHVASAYATGHHSYSTQNVEEFALAW